jgi:lysophospholipase L1-like esterase
MFHLNSYCKFNFNGTRVDIQPDPTFLLPPSHAVLRVVIDDRAEYLSWGASNVITLDHLSAGNHSIRITLCQGGSYSFRFTGFEVFGGTGLIPQKLKPETNLFYGDSLGEYGPRDDMLHDQASDNMTTYANLVADVMGEYGIVSMSGSGWLNSYIKGVPTFPNFWSNYAPGQSRLVDGKLSPQPNRILINLGTNDAPSPDITETVASTLTAIRAAAPQARIYVMIPFSRSRADQVKAGFDKWKDGNSKLIDLGEEANRGYGAMFSPPNHFAFDGVHNTQTNNARLAVMVIRELQRDMSATEAESKP